MLYTVWHITLLPFPWREVNTCAINHEVVWISAPGYSSLQGAVSQKFHVRLAQNHF
jgi:hypothetical protein